MALKQYRSWVAGMALALLMAQFPAPAAAQQKLEASDRALIEKVQAAIERTDRFRGRIWPSFALSSIPLVIHDPGRVAFLFNYPRPYPQGYQALPGFNGVAVNWKPEPMLRGFDTEQRIGDRTGLSVEVQDDPAWKGREVLIAVHEGFHVHQHSFPLFDLLGPEVAVHSHRDLALAEVEQRQLANALVATGSTDVQEALRRFVAVRRERQAYLPQDVQRNEVGLESFEGTARYVDALEEVFEADPQWQIDQLAAGREGATPPRLASLLARLREPLEVSAFGRSRSYSVGAAMGLALDRLEVDWKGKAEQGVPLVDLVALASAYDPAEQPRLLASVLQASEFESAVQRFRSQAEAKARENTAMLRAFHASPGRKITLLLPRAARLSLGSENHLKISRDVSLQGEGSELSLESPALTVYVADRFLLEYLRDRERHQVTFFLPEAEVRRLVGKNRWPLKSGAWRASLKFSTPRFQLQARQVMFKATAGTLTADLAAAGSP